MRLSRGAASVIGGAAARGSTEEPGRRASLADADASPFARRLRPSETRLVEQALAGLGWDPLFHFVMRADASDEAVARCRLTLASLAAQTLAAWRLILVVRRRDTDFGMLVEQLRDGHDDARALRDEALAWPGATDDLRRQFLDGFDHRADKVAFVVPRPSTSFADLIEGPERRPAFIAIVGAGDELRNDAVAEMALATGLDRDASLLYCDEERINPATRAVERFCKPQWSPDLLLSTNYIGRLWCAAPPVFARAGGLVRDWLRQGEYDLVLRCTEAAESIRHVPEALCRRWGDRLDRDADETAALSRALARRGTVGDVLPGCEPGFHSIRRQIPRPGRVSIIIPTRASRGLVRTCIETLRRLTDYPDFEIVCIDDIPAADRATKAWLRAHADIVIAAEPPFNWSRFNNRAARAATGEYLLFLNDDVEITEPGWLTALVGEAQRREVGAVGARLLYPDGTVQHAGMFLMRPWIARHAFRGKGRDDLGYFGLARARRDVTAVTGACLMTRRDVFEQLGGFDEAHDVTNNDLDFCLKVGRAGLLCLYVPEATLVHHEQATRSKSSDHFDETAFALAWGDVFARGDPYHHPALAVSVDDFAVEPEPVETVCVARPLFDRDGIRRILAVKLDQIGDCIGAIPAIRRLRQHFPQATIDVLAGPWSDAIWSRVPEIDEVIHFAFFGADSSKPPRRIGPTELGPLQRSLAPRRYDLAVDLRKQPETRPILRFVGARHTAGFDWEGSFPWLDISLEWEGDRRGVAKRQYVGDALVDLVDAIAAAGESDGSVPRLEADPRAEISDPELHAIFGRRVVCVHPAVGSEMRRWPAGHFARLIDLLIEGEDVNVVLIGTGSDTAVADAVLAELRHRDRVAVAVGRVTLGELPGFLARCALFVGNNSGPKHIAAAVGVATVGVHSGNVDSHEWAPAGPRAVAVRRRVACSPCYLTRPDECPRGLACLTELRPLDVYPVCRRMLAMSPGTAPDA